MMNKRYIEEELNVMEVVFKVDAEAGGILQTWQQNAAEDGYQSTP